MRDVLVVSPAMAQPLPLVGPITVTVDMSRVSPQHLNMGLHDWDKFHTDVFHVRSRRSIDGRPKLTSTVYARMGSLLYTVKSIYNHLLIMHMPITSLAGMFTRRSSY